MDKSWLEAAYADYSAEQIAAALGSSGRAVRYWLARHGIRTRTHAEAQQHRFESMQGRVRMDKARQMVTGAGHADHLPGTVKHFGSR